jgi:DNA-binding NtrC family response regulator
MHDVLDVSGLIKLYQSTLACKGYRVIIADSINDLSALKSDAASAPDMIILNALNTGENTCSIIKEINEKYPAISVIAVTSDKGIEGIIRALDLKCAIKHPQSLMAVIRKKK